MANDELDDQMMTYLWERQPNNQDGFVNIFGQFEDYMRGKSIAKANIYRNNVKGPQKAPLNRFLHGTDPETVNLNFPGLSNVIEFREVPNRGRCAFATNEIGPCRTISAINAFASVVDRTDEPYCLTCHETQLDFNRCVDCENVYFCNTEECEDGNQTHRFECGSDFHNIKFGDDLIIKCAIQMVFESLVKFGAPQQTDAQCLQRLIESVRRLLGGRAHFNHPLPNETRTGPSKFECIMQLQGMEENLERRTDEAFNIIMNRMPTVANIFQNEQDFLQHLLMHFLKILRENSFESLLNGNKKLSIYDIPSLFNHSCSPNLINIFDGTKMYLTSSRRIARDEELCISYISDDNFDTQSTRRRRAKLEDHWSFVCSCERCQYADTHAGPHNEITQQDINDSGSRAQNRLKGLEDKLKRKFPEYRQVRWDLKVGAMGLKYKSEIIRHLN